MHRTALFHRRDGSYETYRIPVLAALPGGRVLLFCEARRELGDWSVIDIVLRESDDDGATWAGPRIVFGRELFPEGPIHNPTVIVDGKTGMLHGILHHNYERAFYFSSADGGRTFSGLREITATYGKFKSEYDYNVCATGPGRGELLAGGRLVLPVWFSTGGMAHRPSVVSVVMSDDGGGSWRLGPIVAGETTPARNPSEALLVSLGDGRLLMNIRNESHRHRRLVAISEDGGDTWGEPFFDEALYDPICHAGILRLSDGRIAFANPDARQSHRDVTEGLGPRENLCLKTSGDDCQTWSGNLVIEPGAAGYSSLAQGSDGAVLCAFEHCAHGADAPDSEAISVVRIPAGRLP